MNPLRTLFGTRRDSSRKTDRTRRRPSLEGLEGRIALSTASPIVGPISHGAALVAPAANGAMTKYQTQTGAALGLGWRAFYDSAINTYRLDIQDVAGRGQTVVVGNTGTGTGGGKIWFTNYQTAVNGPAFPTSAHVQVRVFSNNPASAIGPDKIVSVLQNGVVTGVSYQARTTSSNVSSPSGPIGLTCDYNCVTNTATLTVNDISGSGTYGITKAYLNPSPGDPPPDSPSGNPLASIVFQEQGSGGSDYNGSISVFHAGLADPTVHIVIKNAGSGRYAFKNYTGF